MVQHFEGWTVWESLYFTFITMTTIGFGDFTPTTETGRISTLISAVFLIGLYPILANLVYRALSGAVTRAHKQGKRATAHISGSSPDLLADLEKDSDYIKLNITVPVRKIRFSSDDGWLVLKARGSNGKTQLVSVHQSWLCANGQDIPEKLMNELMGTLGHYAWLELQEVETRRKSQRSSMRP